MPFRVGPNDLKDHITIASRDEQGSPINLHGCISTANTIVDIITEKDTDGILSERELKEIEKYLAIHFYTFRDQQYQSTKVGDAEDRFQGKTEMYWDSSFYGQTAKMLDRTGLLAAMQEQSDKGYGSHQVKVEWMAQPYTEYEDYENW